MNTLTIRQKSSNFKLMGGKFQEHFDFFNACVKNEEDLKGFYQTFNGNCVKSIMAYRMDKLNEANLSLGEFLNVCKKDIAKGLELLFLEAMPSDKVDRFEKSGISLKDLYAKSMQAKGTNLTALINNFDMVGYKWDGDDTFLLNI
ncbi:hypothetical protein J2T56_002353 [Natronobacillus azotifigens]|uniref:Uncharacterized protein n=1 Tax=Natronobacillus azotifigens TaxID=472978 RepID=A0A9J6RF93_9BACI|nr:hypothetical protein [Natronobacillus azotifigens]MCZ0704109.1 hypothetical protein [Natronobacillus azotifigens]